jgi:hypothetical protein
MSIKTSADEWVRKGPTQAIAVVAAVGIIVGGLVGFGAGFKVEQSRTKDEVKKLQRQAAKAKAPTGALAGPLGQRIGEVTAISGASITVTAKKRGAQTLVTTVATRFETTERGTIADVHSGDRILVTAGGAEIIVLPADFKIGRKVTSIDSSSIKIAKGNGFPAGTLKTTDVHRVDTAKAAKLADVSTGDSVLAGGRARDNKVFNTIEVIVLPDGSGFANN